MMLGEGLQAPVGGRRSLREAIVNLVGDSTALLVLYRDNPTDQAVQFALAFGKLLIEEAEFFLSTLAICDVADHQAKYFTTPVKDHARTDFHVNQVAILAAMSPSTANVPPLLQHSSDIAVRIFPGVGDEIVEREVRHFLGGVAE